MELREMEKQTKEGYHATEKGRKKGKGKEDIFRF